jgi:two-component system, NtrC family, response regulator HydG
VDDDNDMQELLQLRLQSWDYEVCLASDADQAQAMTAARNPDVVISDILMPGISGLELLRLLKAGDPKRPVILMTVQDSVSLAVEAMKEGAQDFLVKPLDYGKLHSTLEATRRDVASRRQSQQLSLRLAEGAGFGEFVGMSKAMCAVYELIKSVANTSASILVTGESGTGKELVARTIHQLSKRAQQPFIAVNTAAIPETLIESELFGHERGAFTGATGVHHGWYELANLGTLFLDEITEMPIQLQPRLLRVLEDGKLRRIGAHSELALDVRVIAATNQIPRQAIASGKLREDLFFRLNVINILLPPLRERREDIQLLVQHFIGLFNQRHECKVEYMRDNALETLRNYSWPGNVRELSNVLERAVILARTGWIEFCHLPPYVQTAPPAVQSQAQTVAEVEKELILKTLKQVGYNKVEAARLLGLDVKTIRNKLKAYGYEAKAGKP